MRCQVVPLPDFQTSFVIDGRECLRWHFGPHYPRPFFYPWLGPDGQALTRLGHPGAPNHDHHRSIWFGHQRVGETNFWEDPHDPQASSLRGPVVRQSQWLVYDDSNEAATMAVKLSWLDADERELLEQQLVARLQPAEAEGFLLTLESTFRPGAAGGSAIELGQTNFGFLGVRVARSIAEYFGGGRLTNSEGGQGEADLFGQSARWVDYSGPVPTADSPVWAGVTYFDHPSNPGYPGHWHVREDGWMAVSACRQRSLTVSTDAPLHLRYLLHAHGGPGDRRLADAVSDAFGRSPRYDVVASDKKHTRYELQVAPTP